MEIYLFDNTPDDAIVEEHGPMGPAHAGTVTVDYEYQVEIWVEEVEKDHPNIVKAHCPDLGRMWERHEDKMVEVSGLSNAVDKLAKGGLIANIYGDSIFGGTEEEMIDGIKGRKNAYVILRQDTKTFNLRIANEGQFSDGYFGTLDELVALAIEKVPTTKVPTLDELRNLRN
jgi:hypothetical protein